MRNALISVLIFFLLLSGILFLDYKLDKICKHIENTAVEIETILDDKNMEKAYDKSVELLNYILETDFVPSIYTNHQDFDAARSEIAKLCVYIKEGELSEADASLHYIKYSINTIRHLQRLSWDNIF